MLSLRPCLHCKTGAASLQCLSYRHFNEAMTEAGCCLPLHEYCYEKEQFQLIVLRQAMVPYEVVSAGSRMAVVFDRHEAQLGHAYMYVKALACVLNDVKGPAALL